MPLEQIIEKYRRLGYAVNDDEPTYFDIDGIDCFRASTTLTDKYEFSTQWGCIGQGDTLVSPMQLMMWQSAIANGTGKMTMPRIIDRVSDVYGDISSVSTAEFSEEIFSPTSASTMKQILLTNGANHYQYSIPGFTVGIKSGTAQVKEGAEENALLVGFVDDQRKPIAFCVLLENKYSTPVTAEGIVTTLLNSLG